MTERAVINTTIDRAQHTVLVVDDNPTTRYSTARIVRAAGFQTLEAATGLDAVAMATRGISAVVLDVHLPDIDGFEVCRRLRAEAASALLPVIHLSATYVQNADKVAGLNAGADAYLVHPVEPAVLTATLQALIRARMAEDSLRRSDTRFRAIFSQALSGIALIHADGRFADVNPALVAMLGRPVEALLDRPISDLAPPEWVDFVRERTIGSLEAGATWQGEFPLLRADGSWVYLQWSISAHLEPGLRIGIAVDVSERQELDRRRQDVLEREQAARTTAERHSRTKDDFVAVLSHELRTPLNAISGWVHILKKRGAAPEIMRALEAIDRSVHAQARIISDILDVSRISSGKLHLDRQWCDAAAVVSESVEGLRDPLERKRLRVELDLPAQARASWVDPTRLQQIVWNLMTNAIKFSKEGGAIRVALRSDGDMLTLEVQDFGRGIRPDFLAHLFNRFSQSDSPDNRAHGGLGLGLSIVKHLAQLHGGEATAESPGVDLGATLTVTLHASDARSKPGDAASPRRLSEAVQDGPVLAGTDVLIVEDNIEASEMLAMMLTEGGAQVRVAADYDTALDAVRQQWPSVLVSDIGLPGRDGYELMRTLRDLASTFERPRILAIALTAFSRPQDRERALDAGFDFHLGKPVQPHVLMAAICQLQDLP
ncbi:hybrid sensor histidine kinase/response regulator [Variovorax guangxiensis]|uniref:histidine kinase n=1 Tax=Variovorax guangxiensis TaxID=1775474 RepID=A0A502DUG7_9BURK|nr:response regulator [Variovorax guangxiensis]TPG24873.1 response regulator [Variovorax ginsengisoli]TPG29125.1 response regulator [Variovorax guangxiensis]